MQKCIRGMVCYMDNNTQLVGREYVLLTLPFSGYCLR